MFLTLLAHDCMNRAQRCKSFAPESYRRSTLESSSIRRLLTLQCAAVTFWHAVQLIAQPCTRKSMASSQTKRRLEERFYAVFTGQHAAQQKKHGAKSVCARLLHSTRHCLRRTTRSGPSQTHNKSGRVAPRCFVECVHGGAQFLVILLRRTLHKLLVRIQTGCRIATPIEQFATGS